MTTAQQASVAGENYEVTPDEKLAAFRARRRFLENVFGKIYVPRKATKAEIAEYWKMHKEWSLWYMPELAKEYFGER